jgi:hypothetical protein
MTKQTLPTVLQQQQAMKMATTPESAGYLLSRIEEIIDPREKDREIMIQPYRDLKAMIDAMATHSERAWAGEPPNSSFKDFHAVMANMSSQSIHVDENNQEERQIDFYVAISEDAEVLTGARFNGNDVDSSTKEKLDDLFKSFLVSSNIILEDGVAYQSDDYGNRLLDKSRHPIRAYKDNLRDIINDPFNGFATFLNEKGFDGTIYNQTHPNDIPNQLQNK